MLAKRIIPCLDVKDGRTVKGINFEDLRDVGDAVELGRHYATAGADELVYLDISATREGRSTFTRLVERIADGINIPFTVGGGISSVDDAARLLDAGADKVTVNSAAVRTPDLIDSIATRYGNQFVVVAIDARLAADGVWHVTTHGGSHSTDKELYSWAREAESRGAGSVADIAAVLTEGCADAALAASIFHFGEISIRELKKQLQQKNIPVRL